jgi:rhodanese-related sulfurtransferase
MTDVAPPDLLAWIRDGAPPVILDVRSRAEFDAGHVPGSIHIPFWALPFRAGELRAFRDGQIVVYCGHGPRAILARSVLRCRGFTQVSCLAGHMATWRQARYPEDRVTPEP